MTTAYQVLFTPTFNHSLQEVVFHQCKYAQSKSVIANLKKVIAHFTVHVKDDPTMYCVCRQALSLGINKYREYAKNKVRIIYAVDDDQQLVTVHLIAGQKQDLCSLLLDYVLLH